MVSPYNTRDGYNDLINNDYHGLTDNLHSISLVNNNV